MPSRMQTAKTQIVQHFDQLPQHVLKYTDLVNEISANRQLWKLPQSLSVRKFLDFLVEEGRLKIFKLAFPYRPETRYVWGEVSLLQVAASIRVRSYLSHYTAMRAHGLTEQIPKTIYVNAEQTPKPRSSGRLEQNRIDLAFRSPMRMTSLVADVGENRICLLNGMHTNDLGVVQKDFIDDYRKPAVAIRLTNVERTLIDIAVRPAYAGGVFEVLKAYRNARHLASVEKLAAMLRELNFVYPYHQAIGFYLEKAGFETEDYALLHAIPKKFDFYLTHQMREKDYSSQWRLFYPKGL